MIIPFVSTAKAVYHYLEPAVSGHTLTFRLELREILSSESTYTNKKTENLEMGAGKSSHRMINET